MSTSLTTANGHAPALEAAAMNEFVTFVIGGQLFGIPVLEVQDVLGPQKITRVPLAPPEIAGSLNLRGRIVTAIDVRVRLGIPPRNPGARNMSIVVDHHGEFYSIIVDQVGEVMELEKTAYEKSPATMDDRWRSVAAGVYRLAEGLLIVLDTARLLNFAETTVN